MSAQRTRSDVATTAKIAVVVATSKLSTSEVEGDIVMGPPPPPRPRPLARLFPVVRPPSLSPEDTGTAPPSMSPRPPRIIEMVDMAKAGADYDNNSDCQESRFPKASAPSPRPGTSAQALAENNANAASSAAEKRSATSLFSNPTKLTSNELLATQLSQLVLNQSNKKDVCRCIMKLEKFTDFHRLVLQGLMHAGFMNARGVRKLFRESAKSLKQKIPSKIYLFIQKTVRDINYCLQEFDLVIRSTTCEITGVKYYVFVIKSFQPILQMQTYLTPAELELFNLIADKIILRSPNFLVSPMDCVNIDTGFKEFTKLQAESCIERMIQMRYLTKVYRHDDIEKPEKDREYDITIGFRSIKHFEPVLTKVYGPTAFVDCRFCKMILLNGLQCPVCPAVLHRACARKYLEECHHCLGLHCDVDWPNLGVLEERSVETISRAKKWFAAVVAKIKEKNGEPGQGQGFGLGSKEKAAQTQQNSEIECVTLDEDDDGETYVKKEEDCAEDDDEDEEDEDDDEDEDDNLEDDNLKDDNLKDDNLEDDKLKDDNWEEDNLKDENLEDDNLKEDNLEDGNLEDDNLEDDNLEEDKLEDDNLKDGNLEDDNLEDDNLEEDDDDAEGLEGEVDPIDDDAIMGDGGDIMDGDLEEDDGGENVGDDCHDFADDFYDFGNEADEEIDDDEEDNQTTLEFDIEMPVLSPIMPLPPRRPKAVKRKAPRDEDEEMDAAPASGPSPSVKGAVFGSGAGSAFASASGSTSGSGSGSGAVEKPAEESDNSGYWSEPD